MEPYVVCQTCGEKNDTNFSYCRSCGTELTLEKKSLYTSQESDFSSTTQEKIDIDKLSSNFKAPVPDQHYIEGASKILTVKKIWVSLRTSYKIYDSNDQLFLSVNQPFYYRVIGFLLILAVVWAILAYGFLLLFLGGIFGIILFYLLVRSITRIIHGSSMVLFLTNADGSHAGKLKGNSSWSEWQIIRGSGEKLATFRPYQAKKKFGIVITGMGKFDGELILPTGTFKLKSQLHQDQSPITFSLNLLDMDDKCYLSLRPISMRKYQFEASDHLEPLVACGVAVCLSDQLMQLQSAAAAGR